MNSTQDSHSRQVLICNEKGLHARASALFVKCAQKFDATISVAREGETVSGESIMDLLMLAAAKGTTISITTTGIQAAEALEQLTALVEAGFYEEE